MDTEITLTLDLAGLRKAEPKPRCSAKCWSDTKLNDDGTLGGLVSCKNPVHARGLCQAHYRIKNRFLQDRRAEGYEVNWDTEFQFKPVRTYEVELPAMDKRRTRNV